MLSKLNHKCQSLRSKIVFGIGILVCVGYVFCLPATLFVKPYSTVLFDSNGILLSARVAKDQQWRFAPIDTVPEKFERCVLTFEDKHFYHHIGISCRGIARAICQNIASRKIVSGGSTITMQVVRLMRNNPPRTFFEKSKEMLLATRIECAYSKKNILKMYVSNAPFGNNIVGLPAASWRYYGKLPDKLSWAESATLAVLPNAPGLIYPGKNHHRLLLKRNRLLKKLLDNATIDSTEYCLAVTEPLPNKPLPLPIGNEPLLQRYIEQGYEGKNIYSTIDNHLQILTANTLLEYINKWQANEIHNAAVIITHVKTGKIVAYQGNVIDAHQEYQNQVDCANAPRSTGSILKPLLYARCLESGLITPVSLLPDMPSSFGNFSPKNYNKTYDGAVPADECLVRSLNIPMVHLLNNYGVEKFQNDLRMAGFHYVRGNSKQYGLSLILGGAEVTLSELNEVYSRMAITLLSGYEKPISMGKGNVATSTKHSLPLHAAIIYQTFEAMKLLNRPDEMGNTKIFESSQSIAWKTGTSFGNRDAWAVGITPDYVVSVWVGNASGEGRPSLTGLQAAAPILFSIFNQLPKSSVWFTRPDSQFTEVSICRQSGYRAGEFCDNKYSASMPLAALNVSPCPYHKNILLDPTAKFRVNADNELPSRILEAHYFVLPPLMQKYYLAKHPDYKILPPFRKGQDVRQEQMIQIIYPKENSHIKIPKGIDGMKGQLVMEAVSAQVDGLVYWDLDEQFLGATSGIHQQSVSVSEGKHTLTLMDQQGNRNTVTFEVIE